MPPSTDAPLSLNPPIDPRGWGRISGEGVVFVGVFARRWRRTVFDRADVSAGTFRPGFGCGERAVGVVVAGGEVRERLVFEVRITSSMFE
jgi:hypothetical protein